MTKKRKSAEMKAFHSWLAIRGCQVPYCFKSGQIHHEKFRSQGGKDDSVICLCPFHHMDQKMGRHAMSRDRFNEMWEMDVLGLASQNWRDYEQRD